MIHHVELVARIVAFARLGDPNAISVNGKARWTWCIEDAEKFLRLYPEILAQLTKTPSADHDAGNLRSLAEPNHQPHAVSQGWRSDIENAPRDGTHILGWSAEYGARETWSNTYEAGSPGFAEGRADRWWVWEEPIHNWASRWNPTHWMPLPAPPSPAKTGGVE